MSRQIKFRGKSADGKWHYGDLRQFGKQDKDLNGKVGIYPIDDDWRGWPIVDSSTVGQFTGLKDRKGTPIYEGDILNNYDEPKPLTVKWNIGSACFALYSPEGDFECDFDSLKVRLGVLVDAEVIGNIHDNIIGW